MLQCYTPPPLHLPQLLPQPQGKAYVGPILGHILGEGEQAGVIKDPIRLGFWAMITFSGHKSVKEVDEGQHKLYGE